MHRILPIQKLNLCHMDLNKPVLHYFTFSVAEECACLLLYYSGKESIDDLTVSGNSE